MRQNNTCFVGKLLHLPHNVTPRIRAMFDVHIVLLQAYGLGHCPVCQSHASVRVGKPFPTKTLFHLFFDTTSNTPSLANGAGIIIAPTVVEPAKEALDAPMLFSSTPGLKKKDPL